MNPAVKLLDSIPKFSSISRYGTSLDRQFHINSLENLIQKLKSKKKPIKLNNLNFNTSSEFLPSKNNEKDILYADPPKAEENRNTNNKSLTEKYLCINAIIKQKLKNEMSPCKYNPNYNSIYKKVPYVKIISPENKNNKKKILISSLIKHNDKLKNKKSLFLTTNKTEVNITKLERNNNTSRNYSFNIPKNSQKDIIKININDNERNKKHKNKIFLTPEKLPEIFQNLNNTPYTNEKINHVLKFSHYNGRKSSLRKSNLPISYIEPINYLKKRKNNAINFNKMNKRKPLLNEASLDVPTAYQYDPKYTIIDKNIRFINLSENPIINKQNYRKYLMKKICSSYNVDGSYHLINNSLLLDKI